MRTIKILDETTLKNIFSNAEVLINCNREMLTQLEESMATTDTGDEVQIGTVFTQLV